MISDLAPQQVSATLTDDQTMEILLSVVPLLNVRCLPCSPQYVEAISNKQTELDNYIAEGYKNALSEERRRYCFLVDRQCAVAKNSSSYHSKVGTRVGDPGQVGWITMFTFDGYSSGGGLV